MKENKITEPTNPEEEEEEEETTNFAVILPIALSEELKKEIATKIEKAAMQTLASHDFIKEEDVTTATAEATEPSFIPSEDLSSIIQKKKIQWMGKVASKTIFKLS